MLFVLLLAAFPLVLVACGGDDSARQSGSSTAGDEAGATAASGANGATGASGATGAATGATGSTRKRSSSGGTGGASAGTGGSSPAGSGTSGGTNKPKRNARVKKTKKPHFLPGAFVGQKKQVYDQSRRVCDALTLDGLAHEYNVTPKTPEAVARRYAQAYPSTIRKSVYKGCKAGLTK